VAAASLILQRAGGTLTDARGVTWLYSDGGYIASNSIIHGWTLRSILAVLMQPRPAFLQGGQGPGVGSQGPSSSP
jgi:hypothetical protein